MHGTAKPPKFHKILDPSIMGHGSRSIGFPLTSHVDGVRIFRGSPQGGNVSYIAVNGKTPMADILANVTCCVPRCTNRQTTHNHSTLKFYKFPKETSLRGLWFQKISREPNFVVTANTRVCSEHFVKMRITQYRLYFHGKDLLKRGNAVSIHWFGPLHACCRKIKPLKRLL